jgi:biopolymer transport protein ExbD
MSFTAREARGVIRKAVKRVPEGEEIRHLNIMPMMDMMTILLVAFIFQAAVTATALTANQVQLPRSTNEEPLPKDAATLIISQTGIVFVDAKKSVSIVAVRDGDIDASEKEGGALGLKIPKLTNFLSNYHRASAAQAQATGTKLPDPPELLIIADRATPFRVLHMVMFSAKQKEAGYKRFRLIVQKHYPGR